ncbi:MAG: hypothetical protein QHH13_10915 [Melioribacter sp.]|nr:hypothetical protein [Melioribacter sp.]
MEIFPGTEGLLHISEVADFRVQDINSELKVEEEEEEVSVLQMLMKKFKLNKLKLMTARM